MSKPSKKVLIRKTLTKLRKSLKLHIRRRKQKKKRVKPKKPEKIIVQEPMEMKVEENVKTEKPIRKRFYRCCVPYCPTYGTSDHMVPFPSEDSLLRRIWLDSIPRKNWIVCHNTLICKNHFGTDPDSKDRITGKDIPTLFPQPSEENLEDKYRKIDRAMFQISSHYALPETFGDLAMIPNCDKFIFDFSSLISKYKEQMNVVLDVCKWLTQEGSDRLIFYKLRWDENVVKISISVSIDSRLKPTVALEGVIVDPLDFTRLVPVNGSITHWDQLNLMLLDYGYYDRQEGSSGKVVPWEVVPSDCLGAC